MKVFLRVLMPEDAHRGEPAAGERGAAEDVFAVAPTVSQRLVLVIMQSPAAPLRHARLMTTNAVQCLLSESAPRSPPKMVE